MATGTLRDLLASGMSPEEINALLSQSNVSTAGFDPMGTTGRGEPYMPPQTDYVDRPGMVEQAPLNMIRNNSTGRTFAPTDMYGQPSQSAAVGPITDPTRGYVDTPAGRGMYMKADPLKVVLGDGRIVDLGRDTGAERARMKENLAMDKARADISHTQATTDQLRTPAPKEDWGTIESGGKMYQIDKRSGKIRPAVIEGEQLAGKDTEKPLPISAAKGLLENQQNLRRAQQALALIKGNNVGTAVGDENATGWKGYAPDSMLQRMDPQGVDTRAAIGDIGSLVIHQRSGAAVTASEFPRLRPFIPLHTDDPETARKKLNRFVQEYQNIATETADFYKESGFKVPTEKLKDAGGPGGTQGKTAVREVQLKDGRIGVEYSDGTRGFK